MKLNKDGELVIDISELFSSLDEKTLSELGRMYGWSSEWYKAILKALRNDYGCKNYNEELYNIRQAFLTIPFDYGYNPDDDIQLEDEEVVEDVTHIMSDTIVSMLNEIQELKDTVRRHENAWSNTYNYLKDTLHLHSATLYNITSYHANTVYKHEDRVKIPEKIDDEIRSRTEEWVRTARKYFPEDSE